VRGGVGGHVIYHVALPFVRVDGGLAPGEAAECPHAAAAIRRAQAMSANEGQRGSGGFLAAGEFEEAEILKAFGQVPDDFHFT
jgi:hypothetical protein